MSRLEFSRKTRKSIVDRAAGRCERCTAILKSGEGEVDHILPCALGGEPTVANGRLLCTVCHREKTAEDIRRIRKADRARDKASGALKTRPIAKIKSAGFARSERTAARRPKAELPRRPLYVPKEETQP